LFWETNLIVGTTNKTNNATLTIIVALNTLDYLSALKKLVSECFDGLKGSGEVPSSAAFAAPFFGGVSAIRSTAAPLQFHH
jgi:hypothetical protein